MKKRKKCLKKLFLATLDTSLIEKFNSKEIEQVEDFFQSLLEKKAMKKKSVAKKSAAKKLIKRNLLKIQTVSLNEILTEFKDNLDKNVGEQTWQKFFEENIFLFDSRYIGFAPKFNLTVGSTLEPDFLVYDIYGMIDVFEIKTPATKLLSEDRSHKNYYWSPDVSKAIAQLEKYLFCANQNRESIENKMNKMSKMKGQEVHIIRPMGKLVIGARNQFKEGTSMEEDFYMLRSSIKNIEIILFDEIYASLRNLRDSKIVDER